MGILTSEMKQAVDNIRLCFVATSSRDGVPNVSPKGSLTVWDDDFPANNEKSRGESAIGD
jgi:uncharacterized protein